MVATKAQNKSIVVQEQMTRTLQDLTKLQKVAICPVYEWVFNHGYNRAGDSYERQVVKLPPNIHKEGWLGCLKEFGIPVKHPTWTMAVLRVELPNFLEAYSPLILSGFNEKEYMNQSAEEDGNITKVDGADKDNELGKGEGVGRGNRDTKLSHPQPN